VNCNKRSIAVDLKSSEGRGIVHRLAATADVLVESFGTGVVERLAVDYATIRGIRPDVVYCSISGFGRSGPLSRAPGYDVILQAYSGMMSMTGEKGSSSPIRIPISPIDQTTGLHAYGAILSRLFEREKTGKGCRIEVSLYESAIALLGYSLQIYWEKGTLPERNGSGHESLCPYQAFDTADQPMLLGVANDSLWRRFCGEAGLEREADDPRFRTNPDRVSNFAETVGLVQDALRTRSCASWVEALGAVGIPCAPINTLADLMADPHAASRGMFPTWTRPDLGTVRSVAYPVTTDGRKPGLRSAPPELGVDTHVVLRELGYSGEAIAAFESKGIVAGAGL
jgi:crotonobetainyl-CoA:carnitine CoA-transferase CaiB-like acyl-CoA transferase